jgi:hypothetical protein
MFLFSAVSEISMKSIVESTEKTDGVSGVFKVIDEDFGHGGLETVVASDEK